MVSIQSKNDLITELVERRRDQIDIITELLSILIKPIRITRLIRQMNLNYNYLIRHLKRIDELGLISFNNKEYSLTEKGKAFYELLKKEQYEPASKTN